MNFNTILDLGARSIGNSHQIIDYIKLGEKEEGSNPKSTLEFQLPESLQTDFPAPVFRLPILLPTNNREGFFLQFWELNGKGKNDKIYQKCVGEGNDCRGSKRNMSTWKFEDKPCPGWNCPEVKAKHCKRTGEFYFYVDRSLDISLQEPLPIGLDWRLAAGPLEMYRIKTHSGYTLKMINAQIEGFREIPMLNGDVSFIPMWLSRLQVTVTDGENKLRSIHYLSLSLRLTTQDALAMRRDHVKGVGLSRDEAQVLPPASHTLDTPPPETEPETAPEPEGTPGQDQGDLFAKTTEAHKAIRKYAKRVEELDHRFGPEWLSGLCANEGAKEVEEITDSAALVRILGLVEKKGLELKAAKDIREK